MHWIVPSVSRKLNYMCISPPSSRENDPAQHGVVCLGCNVRHLDAPKKCNRRLLVPFWRTEAHATYLGR